MIPGFTKVSPFLHVLGLFSESGEEEAHKPLHSLKPCPLISEAPWHSQRRTGERHPSKWVHILASPLVSKHCSPERFRTNNISHTDVRRCRYLPQIHNQTLLWKSKCHQNDFFLAEENSKQMWQLWARVGWYCIGLSNRIHFHHKVLSEENVSRKTFLSTETVLTAPEQSVPQTLGSWGCHWLSCTFALIQEAQSVAGEHFLISWNPHTLTEPFHHFPNSKDGSTHYHYNYQRQVSVLGPWASSAAIFIWSMYRRIEVKCCIVFLSIL